MRAQDRKRLRAILPDEAIAELLALCGSLKARIEHQAGMPSPAQQVRQLGRLSDACASALMAIEGLDADACLALGKAVGGREAGELFSSQLRAIKIEAARARASIEAKVRRGQRDKVTLRKVLPLAIEHLVGKHGVPFAWSKDSPFHVICSLCFESCGMHSPDRTLRAIADDRKRHRKVAPLTPKARAGAKKSIPPK